MYAIDHARLRPTARRAVRCKQTPLVERIESATDILSGGADVRRALMPSNCLDCQIVVGFGQNGRLGLWFSLLDESFDVDAVNRGFALLVALKEDLLTVG